MYRPVMTLMVGVTLAMSITSTASTRYLTIAMQGSSMVPTLHHGDLLRVDTSAYQNRNPARGDIIAFLAVPTGQPDRVFVKRVIGLPGATVAVHNHAVFINNHKLDERYVDKANRPTYRYRATRVPRGEFFVLGDNRDNSYDSHVWGMLLKRYIIGRVVMPNARKS